MKKFWRINNNPDLKKSLESLNLTNIYIELLLDDVLDFKEYLEKFGHAYIGYNDSENHEIFTGYGWCEDYDFYISHGYFYCGEINLRKEKLLKILHEEILEDKKYS